MAAIKTFTVSPEIAAAVRDVLGSLTHSNFADRAIGLGRRKDGGLVGKFNAVQSQVKLVTGMDLTDVEVPHTLGSIPVAVELRDYENTANDDIVLVAKPVHREKWTGTTCRVRIELVAGAGSTPGTLCNFFVWGA